MIIAHRGGKENFPENTLYAFQRDVALGVDAIELDVQVSADGIPVVYHPQNLEQNTEGSGIVGESSLAYLRQLHVGCTAQANPTFSYCSSEFRIPTLAEILANVPNHIPLILDLKSLPADRLIEALISHVPNDQWRRIVIYSTSRAHTDLVHQRIPQAVVFEDREITRRRLLDFTLTNPRQCRFLSSSPWLGFELRRPMEMQETLTLGGGHESIIFEPWNRESIQCTRSMAQGARIVLFGINNVQDYEQAWQLGVDAVYTDNPLRLIESTHRGVCR